MNSEKKLYRPRTNRIIAGVCSGIAIFFGLNPNSVRLLFVLFTILGGAGVLAYIVLWMIVPQQRIINDYFKR